MNMDPYDYIETARPLLQASTCTPTGFIVARDKNMKYCCCSSAVRLASSDDRSVRDTMLSRVALETLR